MAYIDVSKIKTIRFMCHKILPLVYDESLSYYEVLCKVANKLNEVIDATNTLEDNVSYLNDRVTNLNTRVTNLENEMGAFEARILELYNNLEADLIGKVDAKLEDVDNQMVSITNRQYELEQFVYESIENLTKQVQDMIQDAIDTINAKFEQQEYDIRVYVQKELEKAISEIPGLTEIYVVNPVQGRKTLLQTALDDIFMNTRYYALTCDEFNELGYDINKLNTLMAHSIPRGWKIIEWLTHAKRWLKLSKEHKMFKPTTGEIVDTREVVETNADMFRECGAFNINEFNELNMDIDTLLTYNATAFDLGWRSNRVFA